MDRLFTLFLLAALLYHLIHSDHAHQALAPEPVRGNSHGEAEEAFDALLISAYCGSSIAHHPKPVYRMREGGVGSCDRRHSNKNVPI